MINQRKIKLNLDKKNRTYIGKPIEYDESRSVEELKELVFNFVV